MLTDEKKRKRTEKRKKEIEELKNETEMWQYVNKERKQRSQKQNRIGIETWKNHFIKLYKAKETRQTMRLVDEENNEKMEISEDEVEWHIKKLKNKKSPGEDQIKNEVWKYGNNSIKKRLIQIYNGVWKGKGFPKVWRQGVIVPLHKKGSREDPRNYRGITLLNGSYKIYATILTKRLQEDLNIKELLPDNQAGFREGRSTLDNIYILKHIIDREISKEKGKLYAFFADLKSAFDLVDRNQLWEIMRKRGIDQHITNKIREIYAETSNRVRVGNSFSTEFWTEQGLRQGCPLSPILFAIYTSDLEETLKKWQAGGIKVGNSKIWSLAYADDIVLVAESANELKEMLKKFKKYLEKRKMELSPEKSKIIEFRKGGGREKKEEWNWGEQRIEQVKDVKYLGYVFQKNNGDGRHIRDRVKRARKMMGQSWSLGERIFGADFSKKMLLYDKIIKGILLYGCEIWGWKEYQEVERTQEMYIKWNLQLDRQTPSYIVLTETKRDKIRIITGERAIKFEQKATPNKIREACRIEKRKYGQTMGNKERRKYFERNGFGLQEIKRRQETGEEFIELLSERDRVIQAQELQNKIDSTRYNQEYRLIQVPHIPQYLIKGTRHQKMIARFRCGNETAANQFWRKEEEKKCRMCGKFQETLDHLRTCAAIGEEKRSVEKLLGETGGGINWMKKVREKRKSESET